MYPDVSYLDTCCAIVRQYTSKLIYLPNMTYTQPYMMPLSILHLLFLYFLMSNNDAPGLCDNKRESK